MTKRSESKYKIDRRMGQNIWGRPKSPVNKREYGPAARQRRRASCPIRVRLRPSESRATTPTFPSPVHGIYVEAGRIKGAPVKPVGCGAPSRTWSSRQVRRHAVRSAPVHNPATSR